MKLPIAALLFSTLSIAQSIDVCSYNVFVLGNHTSSYSDIQGRVAVGGNATYQGYDFGLQLPAGPARYDLIAGGTLSFGNGQVEKGSIVAGGNIALTNVTIVGGNVVSGGTVTQTNGQVQGTIFQNQPNPVPVNFPFAATFLRTASTYFGSLPPNAQTVNQWGGLYLTGTDPNLNIFAVSGATLANVWGVQLTVPYGSTVLINVDGASGKLPNGGFNYQGASPGLVLYNFYQATTLNIGAAQGSVLAPFATAVFPYGVANGTIIANALSGNGQTNLAPFTGTLPPIPGFNGTFCNSSASGGGPIRQ
jgi:choice-of-anchor A domain-containing protein